MLALVVNLVILIAGFQAIKTLNFRRIRGGMPRRRHHGLCRGEREPGARFHHHTVGRAIAAPTALVSRIRQQTRPLTITARLKLNYDAPKRSPKSAQGYQVRRDLPPEAEVPIINISCRFALASVFGFNSKILEANQITDYLVRVVQPRLTAIEGVQKANLLGGRTFAMRIWLKPDLLAAVNINADQIRQALGANNFLSAVGYTKGSLVQVNLSANTDLRSVEEFRNLVIRQAGDNWCA